MLQFDIRTHDTAYNFLMTCLQIPGEKLCFDYIVRCEKNFERFWDLYYKTIDSVDFSDLRVIAFHVTGRMDHCDEIKRNGLYNLQRVLTEDTELSRGLRQNGILVDVKERRLYYNDKQFDIDYSHYRGRHCLNDKDAALQSVAHRIYYDYCVNGFLANSNIYSYGTNIHLRPEFILDLVKVIPELSTFECELLNHSRSYMVTFYATLAQIHRFTFQLDEVRDPPFENWAELSDIQKVKKWMIAYALEQSFDQLHEEFLYIRDDVIIPPNQVLSCEEIPRSEQEEIEMM